MNNRIMMGIRIVVNGPKIPTAEPRCHSDQVDPLVKLSYYVYGVDKIGFQYDF